MPTLTARVTSAGGTASYPFEVAVVQPSARYMMGLSAAEIQALPDPRSAPSGSPAYNVYRQAAKNFTAELDLSSGGINQMCGSWAFAAALMHVYLKGKDEVASQGYRARVVDYLNRWITWSGGTKYSNYARKLSGAVMCADLIDFRPPTWLQYLGDVRYRYLGGHSRWPTLYRTAWESANNHGTNARASFLAASLFIGDDAAVADAIRWTKAWLGDTDGYNTWEYGGQREGGLGPIGGEEAASWCELGYIPDAPNMWAPVNRVVGDPTRDGGQPMELYRESTGYSLDGAGAPVWGPKGGMYQGTALVGTVAGLVLAEYAGHDAWRWGGSAVLRARRYMWDWGPANNPRLSDPLGYGGTGVSHEGPFGWIDAVINAKYDAGEREGVLFPSRALEGYGYSFTDWLYDY